MAQLRAERGGCVNVAVDSAQSADLTAVLKELREQYETVVQKNKAELERWFQSKVRSREKEETGRFGPD